MLTLHVTPLSPTLPTAHYPHRHTLTAGAVLSGTTGAQLAINARLQELVLNL